MGVVPTSNIVQSKLIVHLLFCYTYLTVSEYCSRRYSEYINMSDANVISSFSYVNYFHIDMYNTLNYFTSIFYKI